VAILACIVLIGAAIRMSLAILAGNVTTLAENVIQIAGQIAILISMINPDRRKTP